MTSLLTGSSSTSVDYPDWDLMIEQEAAEAAAVVVNDMVDGAEPRSFISGSNFVTPLYSIVLQNWSDSFSSVLPEVEGVGSEDVSDISCYPELSRLVVALDRYLVPIIVALGVLGNTISFFVFTCTYMRRMSSSVYLAALAVVDTLFLIVLLFSWLTKVGVQVYHWNGWCQFFAYMVYVVCFLSVWFVVSFTIERYLTLRFPLKRQQICRPRRAKIVVACLSGLALVIYSFAVWTSEVVTLDEFNGQTFCQPRHTEIVTAINNADTFVTLILPSIIIIVSNVSISWSLSKFYRSMAQFDQDQQQHQSASCHCNGFSPRHVQALHQAVQAHSGASSGCGSNADRSGSSGRPVSPQAVCQWPTAHRHQTGSWNRRSRQRLWASSSFQKNSESNIYSNSSYNRLQMKVTKMLLLVSTVFLLFNIPSHAVRVYLFFESTRDPKYSPGELLGHIQNIAHHLFNANFASNFILYSATGKTFRRATAWLCGCILHRIRSCARRQWARVRYCTGRYDETPDVPKVVAAVAIVRGIRGRHLPMECDDGCGRPAQRNSSSPVKLNYGGRRLQHRPEEENLNS